ncbi:MAG: hypothetical protein WA755_13645 [Candidatus Acidiferrales bacterium]
MEKSNGKLYWHGASGSRLLESDLAGNITDEYIFFTRQRVARRDSSGNLDDYFGDHLGTSRVVTNASDSILNDSDFHPFGVERPQDVLARSPPPILQRVQAVFASSRDRKNLSMASSPFPTQPTRC